MRKEHKHYTRPKRPFVKETIEEERALIKKYGLKNKREIWKTEHALDRIRSQAKKLITESEKQAVFLARLIRLGLIKSDASIDDILALTKENLFERYLQNIVFKKGLAKTQKGARQLITHKKISIKDKIIDVPSYIVRKDEEENITIKKPKPKKEKPEAAKPKPAAPVETTTENASFEEVKE